MSLLKKAIAEAVGTMMLTLVACGVAVLTGSVLTAALTFGLVIVIMAFLIGRISGCHINPAVSLAMLIRGKMTLKEFLVYIAAQFGGALVGSLLLALFLRSFGQLGGNEISMYLANSKAEFDVWSYILGFIIEVVLTFIFVSVVLNATDEKRHDTKFAGIFIGLALLFVHLLGISLTGTSVNPARGFAPALLQAFSKNSDSLKQVWIWILGPLCGGALAAILYPLFIGKEDKESK